MTALPGLRRDAVVFKRPDAGAVDAEGNATDALTTFLKTRGTWGTPRSRELEVAAQRGQQLDAVVATTAGGVLPGDRCEVKAKSWEVLEVVDVRTHNRIFLRLVEG